MTATERNWLPQNWLPGFSNWLPLNNWLPAMAGGGSRG